MFRAGDTDAQAIKVSAVDLERDQARKRVDIDLCLRQAESLRVDSQVVSFQCNRSFRTVKPHFRAADPNLQALKNRDLTRIQDCRCDSIVDIGPCRAQGDRALGGAQSNIRFADTLGSLLDRRNLHRTVDRVNIYPCVPQHRASAARVSKRLRDRCAKTVNSIFQLATCRVFSRTDTNRGDAAQFFFDQRIAVGLICKRSVWLQVKVVITQ